MSGNSADHPKHDEAAAAVVIVTHNRIEDLRQSLPIVTSQTRIPEWLIIVDSDDDPEAKELTRQVATQRLSESGSASEIHYLGSRTSLGDAGGFALGILTALSLGAEWI